MSRKGFALLLALGFLATLAILVLGALHVGASVSQSAARHVRKVLTEIEVRNRLREQSGAPLTRFAEEVVRSLAPVVTSNGALPADLRDRLETIQAALNSCDAEILLFLREDLCGLRLSDLGVELPLPRLLRTPPGGENGVRLHALSYVLLGRNLEGDPSPVIRSGTLWLAAGPLTPAAAALTVYGPADLGDNLTVLGDVVVYGPARLTGSPRIKGALAAQGCALVSESTCDLPDAPLLGPDGPLPALIPEELPCSQGGCPQVLALGSRGATFLPLSPPQADYTFPLTAPAQVELSVEGGRQRIRVNGALYYLEAGALKDASGNTLASLPRGALAFLAPINLSGAVPAIARNATLALIAPAIALRSSLLQEAPPCESPSVPSPTCFQGTARFLLWADRVEVSGSDPIEVHGALRAGRIELQAPLSLIGSGVVGGLSGTPPFTVLHDPNFLASPPPLLAGQRTGILFWAFGSTEYAYPR